MQQGGEKALNQLNDKARQKIRYMKHEHAHGFESKIKRKKNSIQLKDQLILFDFVCKWYIYIGSMNNKIKYLFYVILFFNNIFLHIPLSFLSLI